MKWNILKMEVKNYLFIQNSWTEFYYNHQLFKQQALAKSTLDVFWCQSQIKLAVSVTMLIRAAESDEERVINWSKNGLLIYPCSPLLNITFLNILDWTITWETLGTVLSCCCIPVS